MIDLTEYTEDQRANIMRNMDAFISATVGAGYSADKFSSFAFSQTSDLSDQTLEALYTDDDLAATIVERIVHDALRSGYELDWKDAEDTAKREAKDWAEETFKVTAEVKRARIYSRLFGGGAVYLGMGGEPVSEAFMGYEVNFLRATPSSELRADSWNANPLRQDFGTVAFYELRSPKFQPVANAGPKQNQMDYAVQAIHESRLIPFYGVRTTDEQMWRDEGWGKSVLHRVYSVLMKFETSFDSVLHTLLEQSIPRYKVKALLDLLASENGELLAKRFQLLNTTKSAYNAIIMDTEEEFDRVEANLGPSSAVVDSAMVRVAGAAGMPVTILFGREPAGQNATGKSDLENWNQQVASEQSLTLGPAIAKIYRYLLASPGSPTRKVPEGLKVVFPAVETPSLQDQVNLYAQRAGADKVYKDMGAATAAEIAIKRAQEPGGQFPAVDLELLRELDRIQKDRLLNPPDPMQMFGQQQQEPGNNQDNPPSDGNAQNDNPPQD